MQLQFKKQSTYDTTPGTVTFNTSTAQIGVGTENGVVTMGGGDISKLRWDENSTAGTRGYLSAGDVAIASEWSSNRFVLYDTNKINIEYSRDGGKTWLDYGASDEEKFNLVSRKDIVSFYLGKWESGETFNPSWQLKVTINNPSEAIEIYGTINMFLINASTSGTVSGQKVIINGYDGNGKLIKTYIDSQWLGWSGWNSYYPDEIRFGGSSSQVKQCFKLEFIFSVGSYTGETAPRIFNIFAYGTNLWTWKNYLTLWGHLYIIDKDKNACFPSSLYVNNALTPANKLLSSSEVDSKIEESWTWGEYN